jgi:hypothetical protein
MAISMLTNKYCTSLVIWDLGTKHRERSKINLLRLAIQNQITFGKCLFFFEGIQQQDILK